MPQFVDPPALHTSVPLKVLFPMYPAMGVEEVFVDTAVITATVRTRAPVVRR
jgi:hypothetical protein